MYEKRLCVTNGDADDVLERKAIERAELEPSSLQPADFCTDEELVLDTATNLYGATRDRLNVLAVEPRYLPAGSKAVVHCVRGSLPSGSVLHVADGLYVASPNLNLLLQSRELHLVNLCQLLGRYWGTFSTVKGEDGSTLKERAPLTTERSLDAYLASMQKVPGINAVREAMRYTSEGAASPQEVNLQLLLSLPPVCNGFALRRPVMNYKVDLDPVEQSLYDAETIRIDLCWPSCNFGLEYLGKKEHAGKMIEDISRWYAAHKKGFDLWFVTKAQLYNPVAMHHIAEEVARRTGKRIVETTWPSMEESEVLIDVLKGARHPEPTERLRPRPLRVPSRGCKGQNV